MKNTSAVWSATQNICARAARMSRPWLILAGSIPVAGCVAQMDNGPTRDNNYIVDCASYSRIGIKALPSGDKFYFDTADLYGGPTTVSGRIGSAVFTATYSAPLSYLAAHDSWRGVPFYTQAESEGFAPPPPPQAIADDTHGPLRYAQFALTHSGTITGVNRCHY